jgi:putative ABC transport system permease protein
MEIISTIGYSARSLCRNPRFSVAALLILGFGIGITTIVFTIVNAVLLRQLPFRNPQDLVWVWVTLTDRDRAFFSIPNFLDVRQQSKSLSDIAVFSNLGANITGSGEAERLSGVIATPNVFELLGVQAVVGRTLTSSDDRPGREKTIVLRHSVWQSRFGGDLSVAGKTVHLNGDPYTIIGVLPQQFVFPGAPDAEFVVPLVLETDKRRSERGTRFLRGFARLNTGVTAAQARSELAGIFERLKMEYPNENGKHTAPRVLPLHEELVGGFGLLLWTLQAAVAGVLLISCANLASMCLARSSERRREFAIRSAIGGSRFQVFAHLLIESLLLAGCAGALGLLLARAGLSAVLIAGPADLPRAAEIAIDGRVVVFTFGLSLLTAIVFGATPARYASRVSLSDELRHWRSTTGRPGEARLRRALVAGEVAVAVVLLSVAGLFMRSFNALQSVETGVQGNVLLVRLSLNGPEGFAEFSNALLPAVSELPGVESAALAAIVPLSGLNARTDFTITGRASPRLADVPGAQHRWVSAEYFRAMGIPLLGGRSFNRFDKTGSAGVAIVDRSLVETFFPNEDPIGKNIRITDGPQARMAQIVGVVGNVKHFSLDEAATPTLYSHMDQIHSGPLAFIAPGFRLVVRTDGDPSRYAQAVREKVRSVNKDVPVSGITAMDQSLSSAISARRFNLAVLEFFGIAALLLSTLGLYAVTVYLVTQRRTEIGIRMALGADRRTVLRHVLFDGMKLTATGISIGIAASLAAARAMSGALFGIQALDPATFLTVALFMSTVSLASTYLAAIPAARVDPARAVLER